MSKRSSDQASPDTPPHSSKRVCSDKEEAKLCKRCDEIDFLSYFTIAQIKTKGKIDLGHLQHLDLVCPFCRYVRGCAEGTAPTSRIKDTARITIRQVKASGPEHMRPRGVDSAYHLEIFAGRSELVCLDLCIGSSTISRPTHPFRMLRRPLESCVSMDLLRSWIEATEPTRGKPFIASDDTALSLLIQRQRFRILDVQTFEVKTLRKSYRYVALSYVWGGVDCARALQNLSGPGQSDCFGDGSVRSVDIEKLPRTIIDVANIVGQLGERYLWVDSLCIDQKNHAEKEDAILAMRSIYQEACLTIVAAEGHSAESGISRLKSSARPPEYCLALSQRGKKVCCLPSLPNLRKTLNTTEWSKRGWTFQEQVLSKRCLYFTESEVLFSSKDIVEREAYVLEKVADDSLKQIRTTNKPMSLQDALGRGSPAVLSTNTQYRRALEEFSSRSLTRTGDRLDAFAGVIDLLFGRRLTKIELQAHSGVMHAGNVFGNALFWRSCLPLRKADRIKLSALGTRALPSWSWSGWSCGVITPRESILGFRTITLNENNIQVVNGENFGRVLSLPKWPYEPECSPLTPVQGMVMHLWLPLIKCELEPQTTQGTSTQHQVVWVSPSSERWSFGKVDISHDFVPPARQASLYDMVIVPNSSPPQMCCCLLFVVREGEYYSRIGSWGGSKHPIRCDSVSNMDHISTKLARALESLYTHIKLI